MELGLGGCEGFFQTKNLGIFEVQSLLELLAEFLYLVYVLIGSCLKNICHLFYLLIFFLRIFFDFLELSFDLCFVFIRLL